MSTALPSRIALEILFDWEQLSLEELRDKCGKLHQKNVRWLAIHHPDNRTREELFRLSGVQVGSKTVINAGMFIHSMEPGVVRIGSRCAFAANVTFIPDSNPNMSDLNNLVIVRDKYIVSAPVTVEDDCWVGTGVILFPGVTVGHHSIIGAGSIVTRDVPPWSIVRGQPGVVVGSLR